MTSLSGIQHLTLDGPVLNARSVSAAAARVAAQRPNPSSIVLDCHAVARVDPRGLSALLELGRAAPEARWILIGLGDELLRGALATDLAERFLICKDRDAAVALLHAGTMATCGR
jgi:ABC-type transporter Mla MlaB component